MNLTCIKGHMPITFEGEECPLCKLHEDVYGVLEFVNQYLKNDCEDSEPSNDFQTEIIRQMTNNNYWKN